MRPLAHLLSVLLHPLWIPTATILLCFAIDPYMSHGFSEEGRLVVYAMVFAMTGLFPLMSTLLMRRSGLVSDLTMPLREERIPIYLMVLIYYGMCYFLLRRTTGNGMTLGIFLGATIAVVLVLLITLRWKISAHMTAFGGLVGAVLAVVIVDERQAPLELCALFVLAGLLGSARLVASDHTPAQIYTGAVLGCACVYVCAAGGLVI